MLPEIINQVLFYSTWIDVHRETSIASFAQEFIEVAISSFVVYLECILFGSIYMGIKAAKHKPKCDKDYIIILGCQIKKDGTLTKLLKSRVDSAIGFAKKQKNETGKDLLFVPSGGKGNDEIISESQAMKNYMLENRIEDNIIFIEDQSTNTYENIKFSNNLINSQKENAKIAFSTTNYHVFRAGVTATEQGLKIEGIGAKTKSYFWINAFIREFLATLFYGRKNHLVLMLVVLVNILLMIVLKYLSYAIWI